MRNREPSPILAELREFEITETVVMSDTDLALRNLERLNRLGVRISIDDFAMGCSSLAYLKRFPIDALKVDRSVIRDIPGGADDSAIVETIAQLEFVNSNLCQRAQGWLCSKAVSKQVVNEMLENPQKLANPATPKITFKSSAG